MPSGIQKTRTSLKEPKPAAPSPEEWNFEKLCPPEEIYSCWQYEFARESDYVKQRYVESRNRQLAGKINHGFDGIGNWIEDITLYDSNGESCGCHTLVIPPGFPDIPYLKLKNPPALGGETMDLKFKQAGYKVFSAGKFYHNGETTSAPDLTGGSASFGAKESLNFPSTSTLTDWGMPSYGNSDNNFSDKANADFAVARLQESHAAPFLLMVGFVQPHVPWYTPQAYLDLYPNSNTLTLAHYDPTDFNDIPQESIDRNFLSFMPHRNNMDAQGQSTNIMRHYLACTSFTDHYLGQVLDALEASPYATNTIVVLLSDHGYHLGEKNTYQKHSLWERSSHVPLIVAGPGITATQTCSRVVSLIDIYPTLVDLCGLPDNPVVEGRSLRPLLDDPATEWNHPAITTWEGNNYAVQTEQYRYIRYSQGSEELYDHSVDLNEITNLASNAAYDAVKEELKQYLPVNMLSPGFPLKFRPNVSGW